MGSGVVGFNVLVIPKLGGTSTYHQWKVLYKSSLESSGAWKYVDDTAKVPVQDDAKKDYVFCEQLEQFHTHAAQAPAQARNKLSSSCQSHMNCNSCGKTIPTDIGHKLYFLLFTDD